MNLSKIKDFLLDILFPKICLICQREGDYLCQDCLATLEVLNFHQRHSTPNLTDLYFALPYQNINTKRLIQKFKYQPFIKELAKTLASLIIAHFQLLDKVENFSDADFIIIPIPLGKKRLKWRGFNQAEELSKEISSFLKIPVLSNCLIKIKETQPQVELASEVRKENLKGVFLVKNKETITNKKIILVDDVYTTGSTMEECARVLKKAGAKEIIGIVVTRATPGDDKNV